MGIHIRFFGYFMDLGVYMKKVLGSSVVGARFQVTIPKRAREAYGFKVGDICLFIEENGKLVLSRSTIE